MTFDLREVIENWKTLHGIKMFSKQWQKPYYKIHYKNREDLLVFLIKALKDKGMEKEYFKRPSTIGIMEDIIFPKYAYKGKSRDRQIGAFKTELIRVLNKFWPDMELENAQSNYEKEHASLESNPENDPESDHELKNLRQINLEDMGNKSTINTITDDDWSDILGD